MRRVRLLLVAMVLLLAAGAAWAVNETCPPAEAGAEDTAATITLTINPEARVRASLTGTVPLARPGQRCEVLVKIVNQGFVTTRLEAELVGEVPGATIEFDGRRLRGSGQEIRKLSFTLAQPGHADLTLAFRLHNIDPEEDPHNFVHFLVSCAAAP